MINAIHNDGSEGLQGTQMSAESSELPLGVAPLQCTLKVRGPVCWKEHHVAWHFSIFLSLCIRTAVQLRVLWTGVSLLLGLLIPSLNCGALKLR